MFIYRLTPYFFDNYGTFPGFGEMFSKYGFLKPVPVYVRGTYLVFGTSRLCLDTQVGGDPVSVRTPLGQRGPMSWTGGGVGSFPHVPDFRTE